MTFPTYLLILSIHNGLFIRIYSIYLYHNTEFHETDSQNSDTLKMDIIGPLKRA